MSERKFREVTLLVAERRGLTPREIYRNTHARAIAWARQEVFYLLWSMTSERGGWRFTIPQIAAHFGLDHTTVLYGIRRHMERAGLVYEGRQGGKANRCRPVVSKADALAEMRERAAARWNAVCAARGWPTDDTLMERAG